MNEHGGGAAVTRPAHAKINVFLRVLGKRADGFHDLESVVLPISLHDDVRVEVGERPGISVAMEPIGGGHDREPIDERENLAGVAARALAGAAFGGPEPGPGAVIHVSKRIPVAAGLGGGSADAAATLLALNELWSCALSPAELSGLGAEVGSDVPALLVGEAVFVTGRGERVTPVHAVTTWWVVKPFDVGVNAADAYAWWDAEPAVGPDPGVLIAALETGDVELLGAAIFNDLQPAVANRHPEVVRTLEVFSEAGALGAVMSGSGPTVAALARHMGHADRLAEAVPGSIVVSGPPARAPSSSDQG